MNKIRLFCFPFAGGSALVYKPWRKYLPERIELRPVELAGRGIRMGEDLYNDIDEAVRDVLKIIRPEIGRGTYALYGHSMGGKIAFELVHRIRQERLPAPLQLFISGRGAPHQEVTAQQFSLLGDEEFKQKILSFGGTPSDLFKHPELVRLFLPLLRNDFRLSETGGIREKTNPLDQDITVLTGCHDRSLDGDIHEWNEYTSTKCRVYPFDGDHFFLLRKIPEIAGLISRILIDGCWPEPEIVR